jgi:hypothetical protein
MGDAGVSVGTVGQSMMKLGKRIWSDAAVICCRQRVRGYMELIPEKDPEKILLRSLRNFGCSNEQSARQM